MKREIRKGIRKAIQLLIYRGVHFIGCDCALAVYFVWFDHDIK